MNKKSKIIIAILIFIFLGLIIFAFASPSDESDELDNRVKQGEVDKKPSKKTDKEVKEDETEGKENNNNNGGNNQVNNNEGTEEDNTLALAEEAVKKAEAELTQEAINAAKEAIGAVTNGDVTELEERLADVQSYVDAKAAVEKAEEELTQEAVNAAEEAIDAVENLDTTELEERLEAVQNYIAAKDLVNRLASLIDSANAQETLEKAQELIAAARLYDSENLIAEAVEKADNEKLTEIYEELTTILEDTDAPEVNVKNNLVTNEEVVIDVDDDTEVTITLSKNGEEATEIENGATINEDGVYTLTVVDAAFNERTVTFTIDTEAPKVTIKSSSVGTEGVYSLIDFKITDNVNLKEAVLNDNYTTNKDGASRSLNFANYGTRYVQGENTWVVYDEAGNSTTVTFIFDTVAPEMTVVNTGVTGGNLVNGTYYLNKNGKVNATGFINEKLQGTPVLVITVGENSIELPVSGANAGNSYFFIASTDVKALGNGEVSMTLKGVKDLAGNTSEFAVELNEPIVIDTELPTVTIKSSSVGTEGRYSKIDIQTSDNEGVTKAVLNGEKTFNRTPGKSKSFNFADYGKNYVEGENTLVVYDLAGNEAEIKFVVDTTAPTVRVRYENTDPTNEYVILRFIADEEIQAVDGYALVQDNTILRKFVYENEAGTIVISDLAGNTTEVAYEITNIDKDEPVGTVTYSTVDPTKEAVIVTVTANEEIQEVEGWTLSNDKKSISMEVTENTTGLVKIKDLAGNESDAITYSVANIDTENPVITLPGVQGASAKEYRVESGTEVTVEDIMATVTDDVDPDTTIAPYKADLLIGTKEENIYNYDFSNGFNTRYIGRYNIYYTYTDAVGNKVDATLLLVMTDTTDPVITIPGTAGRNQNELHVKENQIVSLDDIKATVTDNVDPETKILPVKADLLVSNVASENTYNYDLSQGIRTDKTGRYNITYTYTDKAGHTVTAGMMLIIDEFVTVEQSTENQHAISISPLVIASDVITTIEFKEEVKLVSVTALDETDAADTVDTTKITNNTGEEFGTKYTITAPEIVTGTSTNWDHATLLFENKAGAQYEISNCDDGNANIVVPMVVEE